MAREELAGGPGATVPLSGTEEQTERVRCEKSKCSPCGAGRQVSPEWRCWKHTSTPASWMARHSNDYPEAPLDTLPQTAKTACGGD